MFKLMPLDTEAGYKSLIAEAVLHGDVQHARELAEAFALLRDRHANEAEFLAVITC